MVDIHILIQYESLGSSYQIIGVIDDYLKVLEAYNKKNLEIITKELNKWQS